MSRNLLILLLAGFGAAFLHPSLTATAQESDAEVKVLLQKLASPDVKVRIEAAEALGKLGSKAQSTVPALIAALLDNGKVSIAAENALVVIGEPAIPELLKALEVNNPQLKVFVVRVFRWMKPTGWLKAEPALLKVIHDPDEEVATWAITTLAWREPRPKNFVGVLLNIARNGKLTERVREAAINSLGEYGPEASAAVPHLIPVLINKEAHLYSRSAAASALARIAPNDKEVLSRLRDMFVDSKDDPYLRAAAVQHLGTIGKPAREYLDGMVQVLKEARKMDRRGTDALRQSIMSLLADIEPTEEMATLLLTIALDKEDDRLVRRSAIMAIGKLGEKAAPVVPVLAKAISDDRADLGDPSGFFIKSDIVFSLGMLGPTAREATPVLRHLIQTTKNEHYRKQLISDLEKISGK